MKKRNCTHYWLVWMKILSWIAIFFSVNASATLIVQLQTTGMLTFEMNITFSTMQFDSLSVLNCAVWKAKKKPKTVITSVGEIPYKYLSIERGKNSERLSKNQYVSDGKKTSRTVHSSRSHLISSDSNKTIYIVCFVDVAVWPISMFFVSVYFLCVGAIAIATLATWIG